MATPKIGDTRNCEICDEELQWLPLKGGDRWAETVTTEPHVCPPSKRYMARLEALTHAARLMLQTADGIGGLQGMRDTLGQMEALAPVLEPTAYVRGGGMNLADQAAFLAAIDEFVTALRKLDRREQAGGDR